MSRSSTFLLLASVLFLGACSSTRPVPLVELTDEQITVLSKIAKVTNSLGSPEVSKQEGDEFCSRSVAQLMALEFFEEPPEPIDSSLAVVKTTCTRKCEGVECFGTRGCDIQGDDCTDHDCGDCTGSCVKTQSSSTAVVGIVQGVIDATQ